MKTSMPIPPCLEVCPWGLCSTNRDPQEAYAQGHPEVLDAALPVFACWALAHQPKCEDSREVTLAMSYRELPGPRSWVALAYSTLADHESLCFDGIDNDGDCLVDEEDPDCQ